ncbi:hypothetical protein [Thalassobacillus hwangdonensis]|uniref:DUF2178 domain-containing protein n=1 Tax=Thalassobacillus hwangdonensis TaxID=546108 RepID=A0ABW3L5G8_9BACI
MNSKLFLIVITLLGASLVIGLILQAQTLLEADAAITSILLLSISIILVGLILIPVIIRLFKDVSAGYPHDDERSKKVKLFAAGYSYFISLIIWLTLFAFHQHFQQDDLLMLGLAGMFFSFAISWLIVRKRKDFIHDH